MTKTARYSLIASICIAKGYVPALQGVTQPNRAETREEITLSVSPDDKRANVGADLRDDDLPALPSALKFDSAKIKAERETETLLTRTERAEIRRDLLAYRMAEDARLADLHWPFALALV